MGHLAQVVVDMVDEVLDLGPVLANYAGKRGYPPGDPGLMVYGYTTGVRSFRASSAARSTMSRSTPCRRPGPRLPLLGRFRRRHLDVLAGLFTQSLHLALALGVVKMGRVALDGTKLEASASRPKALSYGRVMDKERTHRGRDRPAGSEGQGPAGPRHELYQPNA